MPRDRSCGKPDIARRTFVAGSAASALAALAGCSRSNRETRSRPVSNPDPHAAPSVSSTAGSPAPPSTRENSSDAPSELVQNLRELESRTFRRIGVAAVDLASGKLLGYRQDERFAMCSTYKVLAVGALMHSTGDMSQRVHYSDSDLVEYSPVTEHHVTDGMTLDDLCDAAVRVSDNTAANLVLRHAGGPAAVTSFLRSKLSDPVTRLDRFEPEVNDAVPGDRRDTTTPAAIAHSYVRLTMDPTVLPSSYRARLQAWMLENKTGEHEIRAGVPKGWHVADKTGQGAYGSTNDVAFLGTTLGKHLALAIFTDAQDQKATNETDLIREVTEVLVPHLP